MDDLLTTILFYDKTKLEISERLPTGHYIQSVLDCVALDYDTEIARLAECYEIPIELLLINLDYHNNIVNTTMELADKYGIDPITLVECFGEHIRDGVIDGMYSYN
jgi:hypothetical protein